MADAEKVSRNVHPGPEIRANLDGAEAVPPCTILVLGGPTSAWAKTTTKNLLPGGYETPSGGRPSKPAA
jgi:hypothetical protein